MLKEYELIAIALRYNYCSILQSKYYAELASTLMNRVEAEGVAKQSGGFTESYYLKRNWTRTAVQQVTSFGFGFRSAAIKSRKRLRKLAAY